MKTEVIFRKSRDGEVIAIFPYILWDHNGNVTSYMHIGQHGACGIFFTWVFPKLATPEEYKPLLDELTQVGYDFKIVKRVNMARYRKQLHND